MDHNKFLNLLKNLQGVMKCPSCGAAYNFEEIQFVGNQDGYFLLSMTCSKCNLPVWVNFFAGGNSRPPMSDLSVADFELAQKSPIATNEVIDFTHFLSNFDGNFKKYLKR